MNSKKLTWIILAAIIIVGAAGGIYYYMDKGDVRSASSEDTNKPIDHTAMGHGIVKSEEQFIRDMIPHHQEAIDTSAYVLERTQNENIKELAQKIVDAQKKEVAMMEGWLSDRYKGSTGTSDYKNMMPNLAIVSGMSLDMLYLQGMVKHHEGAVAMAYGVLELDPKKEVKEFAQDVIEVQTQEIAEMKSLHDTHGRMMNRNPMQGMKH